jgi:radical SAM superfamily enzyme YgiQ (UPF0313 family)
VRGCSGKIPIVWGGVHATLLPEETVGDPDVDIVCCGEGEQAVVEIAQMLLGQRGFHETKGLYVKEKGSILRGEQRLFGNDSLISLPDYSLINVEDYITTQTLGQRDLAVITSRGCPHSCRFCYNIPYTQGRWKGLDAGAIVEHIRFIKRHFNIHAILIKDDNFFVDKKRVEELCRLLLESGTKVTVRAECRVDYIADKYDQGFLSYIHSAGFREFTVGAESGSEDTLLMLGKGITLDQILNANEKLRVAGIATKYTFMAGYPHETPEHIHKTLNLMMKLLKGNPFARVTPIHLFTPYPGTEMYKESIQKGYSPPHMLGEWSKVNFHDVNLPWIAAKEKKLYTKISYATYFLDGITVSEYFSSKPLIKSIAKLYTSLIRWRCLRFNFHFMPEVELFNLFRKIWGWI